MKKIIYPNGIFFDVLFIFAILLTIITIFITSFFGINSLKNNFKKHVKNTTFNENLFGKTIEHDGHHYLIFEFNKNKQCIHSPNCPCQIKN